jgi:ERCC4-type nuclease
MIQIDRRVGSAELACYFPPELHEIVELEFADFAFTGNGPDGPVRVGIERKQIQDLVDSIKTGRLWGHQIPGMIKLYDYSYLVVEGVFKPQPEYLMVPIGRRWIRLNMGTKVIDPYLADVETLAGFMVRQTLGKKQTAQLVLHLFKWWSKEFSEHGQFGPYQRRIRLPDGCTNGALLYKVARVLPGIGVKKGALVQQHFASVLQMVNATEQDWTSIKDVGAKTARLIREAIGHDSVPKKDRR